MTFIFYPSCAVGLRNSTHCQSKTGRWMFSYVLEFLLDSSGRVVFYQKDGDNAGVSAIMRYFPDQDINVVLLSNMEDGVWEPVSKIHDRVMAGEWATKTG